jgi:hypothetical protein
MPAVVATVAASAVSTLDELGRVRTHHATARAKTKNAALAIVTRFMRLQDVACGESYDSGLG